MKRKPPFDLADEKRTADDGDPQQAYDDPGSSPGRGIPFYHTIPYFSFCRNLFSPAVQSAVQFPGKRSFGIPVYPVPPDNVRLEWNLSTPTGQILPTCEHYTARSATAKNRFYPVISNIIKDSCCGKQTLVFFGTYLELDEDDMLISDNIKINLEVERWIRKFSR